MINKIQIFGLFICIQSALHVSGDVFAHQQEHLTVLTAFDIFYVPAGWCHGQDGNEFLLVHETGRRQHRWTTSEAVNTFKCSWWLAKISPENCRFDWVKINKPKFASYWSSITNFIYIYIIKLYLKLKTLLWILLLISFRHQSIKSINQKVNILLLTIHSTLTV